MADPIRLLMVDDEEEFTRVMCKRLAHRGLATTPAFSGEQALELLRQAAFDVIVLDIKLPGISGIETLKALRASGVDAQVILLTGHGTMESALEGMDHGAFDYMMKPVPLETLLQKVEDAYHLKQLSSGD